MEVLQSCCCHRGKAEEALGLRELSYAYGLGGRAEEPLRIRELPGVFAFGSRSDEPLGIRELSYACGFWSRAGEPLGIRELPDLFALIFPVQSLSYKNIPEHQTPIELAFRFFFEQKKKKNERHITMI